MDQIPAWLLPQSDADKFLSCSYDERWTHLKPVIVELYTGRHGRDGRTATLDKVVELMRTHYSFHAARTEYPPRFRAWGVTKRMVKEDKDAITSAIVRKRRPGTSISDFSIQRSGQVTPLDHKKLKRHLTSRKAPPLETIAPGFLSSWNLPYAAFVSSLPKNPDEPSPFGPLGPTPDYLHVKSPEALTPGRAAAGPSPRMQLIYEKQKESYTSLFLQGRIKQLVVSMCKEDRRTMVDYFHDFYMHGFTLAKNWGREPSNPSLTQASTLTPPTWNAASPWTPSAFLNLSPGPSPPEVRRAADVSSPPTQLCKWSIPVPRDSWARTRIPDDGVKMTDAPNSEPLPGSFVESLRESMASNDFTSIPKADLPLAQDMIVESLEVDPSPLQLDAWKLAIMVGNPGLIDQMFQDNGDCLPEGIEAIHPFHLAAAFLDGSGEPYDIFQVLSTILPASFAFQNNTDDLGHTILDALLVTVLRSHTSVQPDVVSYGFHSPNRFPGEEQDICGRWDANTPNVRELFKQGYARIPVKWKHPFCHTAAQAVCQSIIVIFASPASPNINAQGGLFVRRCTECGLELKLGPLHTLVVTAFYLAQLGMPGEPLFGALAVMVCLLALGADASATANVSVAEILRDSNAGQCRHTLLSPLELMQAVPGGVIETWSEECQTGWTCLTRVLALATTEQCQNPSNRSERQSTSPLGGEEPEAPESCSSESSEASSCDESFKDEIHDNWLMLPCNGPQMGLLWAAIQTELLTYRRLSEGDAWISNNFSMKALMSWLEGSSPEFSTPLVQKRMFKAHTRCGWFWGASDFLCPTAEEICAEYFMNMDVYGRASYGMRPDILEHFEDVEYITHRRH